MPSSPQGLYASAFTLPILMVIPLEAVFRLFVIDCGFKSASWWITGMLNQYPLELE